MINILMLIVGLFSIHRDSATIRWENSQIAAINENYKTLLINIRDERISPDSAKRNFQFILKNLHQLYPFSSNDSIRNDLVFPIRRLNWKAIGGTNGNGFRAKGFDLFDARKKTSHPAHDIFIHDRNQDSIDDRLGTYDDILSACDGIVIATETDWQPNSEYRGGNYVWIYDFRTGGLWYYAHQHKVVVRAGQRVQAGEKIGEVGRTGYNAYQKRSETHLHLAYLRIDEDFLPHPVNTFRWLQNARTIYEFGN